MQTHQLERLLRLAQKTGGKLIITDAQGNRPVVILGLDEYEALLEGESAVPVRMSAKKTPRPVMEEDEADVTKMEEALQAAEGTPLEEPKMVPLKNTPPPADATDLGEEQFYLEPL